MRSPAGSIVTGAGHVDFLGGATRRQILAEDVSGDAAKAGAAGVIKVAVDPGLGHHEALICAQLEGGFGAFDAELRLFNRHGCSCREHRGAQHQQESEYAHGRPARQSCNLTLQP